MLLRRSSIVKYFVAAILGVVLYNEWFIYRLQTLFWADLDCPESYQDRTCTKILFVADPQIQGDNAVPYPLNVLFNWDSDRYLKSTFNVVINYFRPDVIVYLGDLMDEGSISTRKQYHVYAKRLLDIFTVDFPVTQVWTPGDNDIGGENEPIKGDKIEEFNVVFARSPMTTFKDIMFLEVNGITRVRPELSDKLLEEYALRVVISHYPLTDRYAFVQKVNNNLKPHIYFCAHDHDSKYVKKSKDLKQTIEHKTNFFPDQFRIEFDNKSVYEINVPTCSYRMGTDLIGFGAAVSVNYNSLMKYTVFWSPTRFPSLFVYLALLIIVGLFCLFVLFLKCFSKIKGSDTTPLLRNF